MEHTVPFSFNSRFKFRTVVKDSAGLRSWSYVGFPGNCITDEVEGKRILRLAGKEGFKTDLTYYSTDQIEILISESEAGQYQGPEVPPEPIKPTVTIDPVVKKEKKAKEPKQPRQPVSENEITIEQLAEELKTTPQKLRSKLRKKGHQKSGARWAWDKESEEIGTIKSYFK